MTDVNTSAITGQNNLQQQQTPLQIMSGWQQYGNQLAQNQVMQQDALNLAQQRANLQQENQRTALGMGAQQQQQIAQSLGGFLSSASPITHEQIVGQLQQMHAMGMIDDGHLNAALQNLPVDDNDPTNRNYVTRLFVSALAGPEAASYILPKIAYNNTGNTNQVLVQNPPLGPNAGATSVSSTLPAGQMTQYERQTPVTLPDGAGGKVVTSAGKAADSGWGGGSAGVTNVPAPLAGPLPGQPSSPDSEVNAIRSGGLPGLAAPSGQPSGNGVTLPPGIHTSAAVAPNLQAYYTDLATVPQHQANAQNLLTAYDALQRVSTGTGSEGLAHMRELAVNVAHMTGAATLPNWTNEAEERAVLTKYLLGYAQSQAKLGGTDLQTMLANKTNPTELTFNPAAQKLVQTNIGRERQAIASVLESQANPTGYMTTKAQISGLDPRAFAADTMSPQELAAYQQTLTPPQRTQFQQAIGRAIRLKQIVPGRMNSFGPPPGQTAVRQPVAQPGNALGVAPSAPTN